MNVVKASVFRRWPVTAPYRGEQTTRLTGGHDLAAMVSWRSLGAIAAKRAAVCKGALLGGLWAASLDSEGKLRAEWITGNC